MQPYIDNAPLKQYLISPHDLVDEHGETPSYSALLAISPILKTELNNEDLKFFGNQELSLLKKENFSRKAFQASTACAGASLALLAVPFVGVILTPTIGGIALLTAAFFFIYRRILAAKLNSILDEVSIIDVAAINSFEIPKAICWKNDLYEGLHCFSLIGAIKLYVQPFFERWLENSRMITVTLE